MDILGNLQSIFKIDLSGLKKLQTKVQIIFQAFSNNKKIVIKGPIIIINTNPLDKNEIIRVQGIIRDAVDKDRIPLLQDDTQKLLEDFKHVDSESVSQNLTAYFKGKIPATDIEALRQSIYVKAVSDRGGDIQKLKRDITARYGNRGKNICNLYSAGYFTSQIQPMYEEMISQPDFSPSDFNTAYEMIVIESPYAVFINREMANESAVKEVRDRIDTAKKYGIRYLNIHGIGEANVDKIVFILEKLRSDFSLPEEIKRQGNVIVVKIQF